MCYTQRHLRVIFIFVCPRIGLGCSTQKTTDSITCALWQAACRCGADPLESGEGRHHSPKGTNCFFLRVMSCAVKIDHPHSWFTMRNCEIEFNTWEAQPSTTRHDKNNDSHVSTDRVSSPIAMVKMAWTQSFLEFSLHASKPLVFPAGMMCLTSRIYQT